MWTQYIEEDESRMRRLGKRMCVFVVVIFLMGASLAVEAPKPPPIQEGLVGVKMLERGALLRQGALALHAVGIESN